MNRAHLQGEGRSGILPAVLPAAVLGLAAALLARRGLASGAGLALVPDLFGKPGEGAGYAGPGAYLEQGAVLALPLPLFGLALAALLGGAWGSLRAGRLFCVLGGVAALLAARVPGVVDLWSAIPGFGLGATARAAAVACLCLALLAGAALESATRFARVAAGLAVLTLVVLTLARPSFETSFGALAPDERAPEAVGEVVGLDAPLPARLPARRLDLSGWIHAELEVDAARLAIEPYPGDPREPTEARTWPVELAREEGAVTRFRVPALETARLEPGHWRFTLELLGPSRTDRAANLLGTRSLGAATLGRPAQPVPWRLALALATFALAVVARAGTGPTPWIVCALCAIAGLDFARGQNPAVPRSEAFPGTRTTTLLAELQTAGEGRVLGGPGVLAGNTGLVHGLAMLDGYDALDPAPFDAFRPYAQRPGAHPLLDWNARGIDPGSAAFRLLGATLAASATPLDAAQWEPLAGPGAEPAAELYVQRLRAPLPRAFLVGSLVRREDVLADPRAFDPERQAFVDPPASPMVSPFEHGRVESAVFDHEDVRVRVSLDGDALLVTSEQDFPGWTVHVDGDERSIVRADGLLRAVFLRAGEREVVFRYAPRSLRLGLILCALGGLLCVGLVVRGSAQER